MRMITYCPKCGTGQLTDSRFCVVCGTATEQRMVEENNISGFDSGILNGQQSQWPEQNLQNAQNQSQNQLGTYQQNTWTQNPQNSGLGQPDGRGNKNNNAIIIVACVVIAVVIASVCIILIAGRSSDKNSITSDKVQMSNIEKLDSDKDNREPESTEEISENVL